LIDVEIAKLLPKNRVRMEKGFSQHGMSMEQGWEAMFPEEERNKFGGVYSEENFDKFCTALYYSG